MFQTTHVNTSPSHPASQQPLSSVSAAAPGKVFAFDGDASVNSGLSLTSSRASLALTNSTLGSQASPTFAATAGSHHFLFSQHLGNRSNNNNHNTSQQLGGFGVPSSDLLSFRMPNVQATTSTNGEYYGSCFTDEASYQALWVTSCIDESVSPQRRPGNGHVKNL